MDQIKNIKLLDGGSGFEAIQICQDIDIMNHKCWSSGLLYDHKDIVAKIYRKFIDAGSEVITSLSYQASPSNLSSSFNISIEEAEHLMAESVFIAKEEIRRVKYSKKPILVAASLGPYGAHLCDGSEYSGSYISKVPINEILESYKQRIEALLKSDPDILAFETIPTIEEVEIITDLMRQYPNVNAWISMSSSDGENTVHGDKLSDVVKLVNRNSPNIFGFGVNCSINLLAVTDTVKRMKSLLDPSKVVVLYPNNGEQYDLTSKSWYYPEGVNSNTFYDLLPSWIEEGASWIGGCCKMGSERMIRVAEIVHKIRVKDIGE